MIKIHKRVMKEKKKKILRWSLQDLGVQLGNTVDSMAADNGQVRHVDRLFACVKK